MIETEQIDHNDCTMLIFYLNHELQNKIKNTSWMFLEVCCFPLLVGPEDGTNSTPQEKSLSFHQDDRWNQLNCDFFNVFIYKMTAF